MSVIIPGAGTLLDWATANSVELNLMGPSINVVARLATATWINAAGPVLSLVPSVVAAVVQQLPFFP